MLTAKWIISGNDPIQSGALFSYSKYAKVNGSAVVTLRFGTSFRSADQACANLAEEVGSASFDTIRKRSYDEWNTKLNRIQLDPKSDATIVELFYTSFYRQFLTPNNATHESIGYKTEKPWFNSLYCTWDTFRTFYPLLSLHSAQDYASIVENYVESWRQTGIIPECRANGVPGLTQGGSDGTNVLADFAVKYSSIAKQLGVDVSDVHAALLSDSFTTPPEWDLGGRQIGVWRQYHYIPYLVFDKHSTGRQTREGSRTVEYAFNDFAARQVALLQNDTTSEQLLRNSSLWYRNVFDPTTKSLDFSTFVQQRRTNGTFRYVDPTTCSPIDNNQNHACSLQQSNTYGIYETSSWEYSLFAPHDTAGLINLLEGGDRAQFIARVDQFFAKDLYYAGNEPSFQTPVIYHYANAPTKSVQRVRQIVYRNFNTTTAGLPGNDDQAAMATLLALHLLGIYPVPSTREYLLVSPFVPSYTVNNDALGSFTVNVTNFDERSLAETIPNGARAYIDTVKVNGKLQTSRCKIRFEQLLRGKGKHTTVELTMPADPTAVNKCGSDDKALPSSLSTGGFDTI